LDQAVIDKERSDTGLAVAHSMHPAAELYTLIESEIQKHNSSLNNTLKTALTDLPNKANTLSPSDFRAETEKIDNMLDQADSEVIAPVNERTDTKFNANVIISLVSHAAEEYGEGVKDGKIVSMVEYQDAQGFRTRADGLFNQTVKDGFTGNNTQQRDNTIDSLKELKSMMNNVEDLSKIQNQTNKTIMEISTGAGIQTKGQDPTTAQDNTNNNTAGTVQYIQITKQLLKQASIEYRKENTTGADDLVTSAYLDNFEQVEPVLIQHNATDLKLQTEQMIRIQLREMIKDKASADEIDSQINAINAKLDQAASLLQSRQ
jgi:hypothetical protein